MCQRIRKLDFEQLVKSLLLAFLQTGACSATAAPASILNAKDGLSSAYFASIEDSTQMPSKLKREDSPQGSAIEKEKTLLEHSQL